MSHITSILNILFGIFLLWLAVTWITDYVKGPQEEIQKLETLLSEGVETDGVVLDEYEELSIKGIKIYTFKYEINVDVRRFRGEFKHDSPESVPRIVKVHYMPNDPRTNMAFVADELSEIMESKDSKSGLYAGLVALLLGLVFLYFRGIKKLISATVE